MIEKMNITDEKIKDLKQLLWILDSKHNQSIPETQENINYTAQEIVKLFSTPDVVGKSEQLSLSSGGCYNCPKCGKGLHISDYDHNCKA